MFSGVAVHRDVSPATNERSSSFTPTTSFGIVTVFPFIHSDRRVVKSRVSVCIFFLTNGVEHLSCAYLLSVYPFS